jgi:hypothetical protein
VWRHSQWSAHRPDRQSQDGGRLQPLQEVSRSRLCMGVWDGVGKRGFSELIFNYYFKHYAWQFTFTLPLNTKWANSLVASKSLAALVWTLKDAKWRNVTQRDRQQKM